MRNADRGNILFLILLAVVLFAALSYAVTSSMRGGGKDGSGESASSAAAAIIQAGTMIEQTITRLRLTGDCTVEQIAFDDPALQHYTYNTNAPADLHCHVFKSPQGKMEYPNPDPQSLEASWASQANPYNQPSFGRWYFAANYCVANIGTGGVDCASNGVTTDSDLIALLPYIKKSVCEEIDRQLGIDISGGIPTLIGTNYEDPTYKYNGNFLPGTNLISGVLAGRAIGCYRHSNNPFADAYVYYHVLVAR